MEFTLKTELTPKFIVKEIYDDWIGRDWFAFQLAVFELGEQTLDFIHEFITQHSKRAEKSGNLVKSIKLYSIHGMAEVSWGIGKMSEMTSSAPYWYLINFGGMSWAGLTGKPVPGLFDGDSRPDRNMSGSGVGTERFHYQSYYNNTHGKDEKSFMTVKSPINPMNYIENAQFKVDAELTNILNKIKAEGIK